MPFRDQNRVSTRRFNRMFFLFLCVLTHVRPCSGAGGRTSVQVGVKKTKVQENREAAHTLTGLTHSYLHRLGGKMSKSVQGMLFLSFLVAFAACNAPPVPLDDILIEKTFVPEQCVRAVKVGDYVRYHYIGMFPDGKKFDSR